MKNKKLTYFLGLVVLVVWGLIIYRIFSAAGGSDDDNLPVASKIAKEPYNDFSIPKDTPHLLLNYRDPFGLVKQKDITRIIIRKATDKRMSAQIKPMDWGFIKYSGYILNPGSKKLVALVSVNGQNITLSEGQTRDQVTLIKNLRDSIKIGFSGKIKFITMKSSGL